MAKEGSGKGKLAKRNVMFAAGICWFACSVEGERVDSREGGEVAEEKGMRRRVAFPILLACCPGTNAPFASGLFAVYSLSASSRKSLISAA